MKHTALRFLIASLLILAMALPLFACDKGNAPDETTLPSADGSESSTEAPTEAETEAPLPTEVSLPEAYLTADIVYPCNDGSTLYTYAGKTAEDFAAVCAHYKGLGFRVYSDTVKAENTAAATLPPIYKEKNFQTSKAT